MKKKSASRKYNYFRLKDKLAVILSLLALALFVSKSLYNVPVGIMAILGLYRLATSPKQLWENPYIRIFVGLFLCFWLPMLLALNDAINFKHSLHTVLPYLRFLFLGVYLISEINTSSAQRSLLLGIFCIAAFWCIDALIQVLFSIDLFGYPYETRHITGMFYPKNTIAHICAGLSPLCFEVIRQRYNQNKSIVLLLFPLFIVILISGRRAAWVMFAVSIAGYLFYFTRAKTAAAISIKQLVLLGAVLAVALGTIVATYEPVNRRVKVTMGLFSGDHEIIDRATAGRLPLWLTSLRIAKENWFNGIGPRGYRHAYRNFADEDDYWKDIGQTHPHQLLLEILTETGVIGLSGLLLFMVLFYRFAKRVAVDPPLFPFAWAVVVVIFPINTHMAFYGSYWSSFFWLLVVWCFVVASSGRIPARIVSTP